MRDPCLRLLCPLPLCGAQALGGQARLVKGFAQQELGLQGQVGSCMCNPCLRLLCPLPCVCVWRRLLVDPSDLREALDAIPGKNIRMGEMSDPSEVLETLYECMDAAVPPKCVCVRARAPCLRAHGWACVWVWARRVAPALCVHMPLSAAVLPLGCLRAGTQSALVLVMLSSVWGGVWIPETTHGSVFVRVRLWLHARSGRGSSHTECCSRTGQAHSFAILHGRIKHMLATRL